MSDFESFALTDIGVARTNNEDYVLCAPEQGKWVLADGVGGHEAGEIASELACATIMDALFSNFSAEDSILSAHHAIIEGIDAGVGKKGMATTVVLMLAAVDTCHIYWVGDSRAYLIDKIGCSQLTVDHSLVQKLIESGSITQEEAVVHPSINVVYQVLGMEPPNTPEIAYTQQPLEKDDVILLCSDGLSDVVGRDAIFNTISKHADLELAAEDLIQQAITNGSRDNISVQVIKKVSEVNINHRPQTSFGKNPINDLKNLYSKLIAKVK